VGVVEGRYSKVTRRMWNDERFRALSAARPNAQTLWLRLLCGPELGVIPGLFAAREAGLADALGWTLAAFRRCWKEIEAQGMATADWRAGIVWVHNAADHNPPSSPNVVKGWREALVELPECDVKRQAVSSLTEWLKACGKAWLDPFTEPSWKAATKGSAKGSSNGSSNGCVKESDNQEQEQEARSSAAASSETDQVTRARVTAQLMESNKLSPEDVWCEWHAAAPPGTMHHLGAWLEDYAAIADTINVHPRIRPENRRRMLEKLCLWAWQDPEGPFGSKRVFKLTPKQIVKHCSTDLDKARASEWVESRFTPAAEEASS
jgi:hypothetical protein